MVLGGVVGVVGVVQHCWRHRGHFAKPSESDSRHQVNIHTAKQDESGFSWKHSGLSDIDNHMARGLEHGHHSLRLATGSALLCRTPGSKTPVFPLLQC
jgi:hypothetical protein